MHIQNYINKQPDERQEALMAIHATIMSADKSVSAAVELKMGREMIIYRTRDSMTYGLSSVGGYMTLYVMPMHASTKIYSMYKTLLNRASFQKGCIHFYSGTDMPLPVVQQLIMDCAVQHN